MIDWSTAINLQIITTEIQGFLTESSFFPLVVGLFAMGVSVKIGLKLLNHLIGNH